jgi:isopentenyl phosphate kinase
LGARPVAEPSSLVFIKLGGSLITDKSVEATARPDVIRRLAEEVHRALDRCPDVSVVLGHGSGSFGHMVARRYHVQRGCTEWDGYALTSAAATRLNRIVTDSFLGAGVPVVSIQPSASARCRAGQLIELAIHPIQQLLRHHLVPLVYGDVALDEEWGSTIVSTEAIFVYLARVLRPQRILLLGELEGVYTADPRLDPQAQLIPVISASQSEDAEEVLGGSHAVDVTGGMRSKVHLMTDLVRGLPQTQVRLLSGLRIGLLERVLTDPGLSPGTLITV